MAQFFIDRPIFAWVIALFIVVGGAAGSQWIVLEGLKAGEQVVAEGFQKMRPGAPVKPVPWAGAGAAAPGSAAAVAPPPSAPASAASR